MGRLLDRNPDWWWHDTLHSTVSDVQVSTQAICTEYRDEKFVAALYKVSERLKCKIVINAASDVILSPESLNSTPAPQNLIVHRNRKPRMEE